jgi:broad specificity phosphatase PhoE
VGQVQARVLAAVRDIEQEYDGRRLAIVAHGLVLALIKAHCTACPITQVWDLIPPNAKVEELLWQHSLVKESSNDDRKNP